MRESLRAGWSNLLASGFHLILLIVAFQVGTRSAWIWCLTLVSAISLAAAAGNFRRYRLMGDTVTSRVASAAQGYVELAGRAAPAAPTLSVLTGLPCLWYRFKVEVRGSDGKWTLERQGHSDDTFTLVDDSGACVIDPDGAEVICRRRECWQKADRRYTEELILANDPLYAVGAFSTQGGGGEPLDERRDVSELLAEWKRDAAVLRARFDLDGDGEVSLHEWEMARREARREVQRRHLELRLEPGVHVMRRPADGRLFLIANLPPETLARRYGWWAAAHGSVALVGGVAAAVMAV